MLAYMVLTREIRMAHDLHGVTEGVRRMVGEAFRSMGGRWAFVDRPAELDKLARAMTAVEDRIELEHGERGEWPARRQALRDARRLVESRLA